MNAPIALFAYSRIDHLKRTVESLSQNHCASKSDLIVFSDSAKSHEKQIAVDSVREYLPSISGFQSVTIYHRPYNFGLSKSIIEGVSQVLREHERVIVLEDDMVTSPYFLQYMNEALDYFTNNEEVISIHGYVYPVEGSLPEAFFLPGADCWGWATWKRGWDIFNPDGEYLLQQLKKKNLINSFDYNGTLKYSKMLKDQIKGRNDSWAVRWYASAFLAGKLTLYPGRSLVYNIGNDDSGTHCTNNTLYNVRTSATAINLSMVNVEPYYLRRKIFENFFKQRKTSTLKKIYAKLQAIFAQ